MTRACFHDPIEPMTLDNTRANGVRSLDVSCLCCPHRAIVNVDQYPGELLTRDFRMVCTECGMIGADVRPNWKERDR
jgi:hypothetical protein